MFAVAVRPTCSAFNTVTAADWVPTTFGAATYGVYVQNVLPTVYTK